MVKNYCNLNDLLSLGFNNWQQSDGTLNIFWDFGANWEYITGWLETIFVGYITDTDCLTFRANIWKFTSYINSFIFSSNILQLSSFLGVDAVASFISVVVSVNFNVAVTSENSGILVKVGGTGDGNKSGNNKLWII